MDKIFSFEIPVGVLNILKLFTYRGREKRSAGFKFIKARFTSDKFNELEMCACDRSILIHCFVDVSQFSGVMEPDVVFDIPTFNYKYCGIRDCNCKVEIKNDNKDRNVSVLYNGDIYTKSSKVPYFDMHHIDFDRMIQTFGDDYPAPFGGSINVKYMKILCKAADEGLIEDVEDQIHGGGLRYYQFVRQGSKRPDLFPRNSDVVRVYGHFHKLMKKCRINIMPVSEVANIVHVKHSSLDRESIQGLIDVIKNTTK